VLRFEAAEDALPIMAKRAEAVRKRMVWYAGSLACAEVLELVLSGREVLILGAETTGQEVCFQCERR
jgi:hypothetical protein